MGRKAAENGSGQGAEGACWSCVRGPLFRGSRHGFVDVVGSSEPVHAHQHHHQHGQDDGKFDELTGALIFPQAPLRLSTEGENFHNLPYPRTSQRPPKQMTVASATAT